MPRPYNQVKDGLKFCRGCQRDLPLGEFHRNGKSGAYRPLCRECRQERRRGDEKELEQGRIYKREKYKGDPSAIHARNEQWRKANPERVREIQRASQQRSRQARLEQYRARGREQARRRWFGRDPLAVDYAEILYRDPCSYCGAPSEHVDHIVALHCGGANDWTNLTAACSRCNSSKRHTPVLLWLACSSPST